LKSTVKVKHLKRYRDRNGKLRLYHRPTGTPILAAYGTAEFFIELARLNGAMSVIVAKKGLTVAEAMVEYRKTWPVRNLAPSTRAGYDKYFALAKPLHDQAISVIDTPRLAAMRDGLALKHGRRSANYALSVMSGLLKFAKERGYVKANAASGMERVRRAKGTFRANRPWTDQECLTVIARAPAQIQVPLALCMFTGMRKRDALTVGKAVLSTEGQVRFSTSKTDQAVSVPLHPVLAHILEARPHKAARTLATTTRGTPWTDTGFDSVWSRFRDGLEAEGQLGTDLTIHGLRHTVGNMLAGLGCDIETIRRVLGHRTHQMAKQYADRSENHKIGASADLMSGPFSLDDLRKKREKTMDS
jgi:integrase